MRLKEKIAIITGSAGGLGRETAMLFASEGAKVALTDCNAEGLAETEKKIKAAGGQCISILADITKSPEINKLVQDTLKEYGKIDILVNCAGLWGVESYFPNSTPLDYDREMDLDLKALYFLSQEVVKQMIKQGRGGKIVNFASIAASQNWPTSASYCAAKGGVKALTRALAVDLGRYHINVNSVSPATIETPMTKPQLAYPEYRKTIEEGIPLGRVGKPADVAFAVLYLASEEADFVTGVDLLIDGGLTCQTYAPDLLSIVRNPK